MSDTKDIKRNARKNLREARNVLVYMEELMGKDRESVMMADAFFAMFNWHLEWGDLKPGNVHLAALLRRNQ